VSPERSGAEAGLVLAFPWMADKPKSLLSRRGGDLTRYLGLGSEQGARLARGERPAAGECAGHVEDARVQIEEVERKLATGARLWQREWAVIMLRGVRRSLRPLVRDDERALELDERACALQAMLREKDREELGALQAEVEAGRYDPARLKADLAARPRFEWDAFTDRVFAFQEVPDRETMQQTDMTHYAGSGLDVIFDIAEELKPGDRFYDLGSGLGKVATLIAWLTGVECKGVEYEPAYVRAAIESARRLHVSNVVFVHGDARDADYSDGDVFYLYEPFRGAILDAVLAKLELASKVKPIRILSKGETSGTLDGVRWLERAATKTSGLALHRPVPLGR
jgi:methyltransferase family protein